MMSRRGLRIDLTLHPLPFPLIGLGGAWLSVRAGTDVAVATLVALLVSVRMRISRI
ncbi:hypothetical protein JL475_15670 [Streptomyces sp. M2CJ-2]|uniref:hypothetical protein n=1 Tax=Streptomyces sp. M2CJ-2 TaxID=2803948 RepID=UPI00192555B9|nr:hypothetical protein [Streptomyces sp. M2CJ-2]MBL3667403.1 hypothetical protein [Streptomyces sp. M2CJ-2]